MPFVAPLAKAGDGMKPEDFVCFRFDGSKGLYIHPNVWHEGVFSVAGTQRFFDRQGAVHARVSIDFPRQVRLPARSGFRLGAGDRRRQNWKCRDVYRTDVTNRPVQF